MIINVKGQEAEVNATPTTFNSATCVRVVAGANALITITNSANSVVGSATVLSGTVEYFEKAPSDTIESNVAVSGASVGFTLS